MKFDYGIVKKRF